MPELQFDRATSYEDALLRAADECGIDRGYWDILHKRHEVSSDVRRRILQALGWDTSSLEALEQKRAAAFEQRVNLPLAKTLVIGKAGNSIPLTLPASENSSVCFDIQLEKGERLAGSVDTCRLTRLGEIGKGDRRWTVYELPLPPEVPLGYHAIAITVNGQFAGQSNLYVCPDRAYLPENLSKSGKIAGFNVALYGLRSTRNWGCGDFTDLRNLISWARREIGFSFIGLNPLHALHNRVPYNTSPYLPLSMFYKNAIYIDVESVPEFARSGCAQRLFQSERLQSTIRRLRENEFVQYQEVDRLKRRFLKLLFRQFRRDALRGSERGKAFAAYCEREGDLLAKFALYCALDEILHKQDRNRWIWQHWPMDFHSPDSEACSKFVRQHRQTIDFYKYVQFVIEEQLAATQNYAKECGMAIGLYHDLALATDNCGSDLWAHGRFYVKGCRVGAPPDDFSPNGQDWAFPPPNGGAHLDDGYRLFRESIRKIVCHGGALRIDHVMRLFRLFWIPEGVGAAQGIYVRDNAIDLMRILALESVRSQNVIIGEDLGTVTDEIRETLARFGILSYRLFYFEKHPKDGSFKASWEYPRQALVASATHDLPTLAGFWKGRDIEARKAAGLVDGAAYQSQMEDRRREKQRMLDALHKEQLLPHHYPRSTHQVPELDGDLHNAIIGFLAQSPSMILLLNQEDLTKETSQQNLPGSTTEYPNWQRKMPVNIEDLRAPWCQPYTDMFRHQLARTNRRAY